MSTIYTNFITQVLDDMKTYMEAQHTDIRFFFGPIAEGDFFDSAKPAVSIQFNGMTPDPKTGRGWIMDVSLVYMKYDPSYTDDYDCIDDAQALMNTLEDHFDTENADGNKSYGDTNGADTVRFPHEDSYVFMFEIKTRIWKLEPEA